MMREMRTPISQALRLLWLFLILPAAWAELIYEVKEPTGKAVQLAIDACAAKGGGVAYLPPGRYVSGPLWLKDNVELRLEAGATVVLSPDKGDWPAGARALVNAKGAKHIAITGRGTFDGNAQWANLVLQDFHGQSAQPAGPFPAILKENVTERRGQ